MATERASRSSRLRGRVRARARRHIPSPTWARRRATWEDRRLPDFIIIGAQKSGTSTLYELLDQHPQLTASYRKEVHFFDGGRDPNVDTYALGTQWYRSNFPTCAELDESTKTFEATPLYMLNPLTAERIAETLPDARVVAVLRNPTDRAISHYRHERQRQKEDLDLLPALLAEEERLHPALERQDYKDHVFARKSYKRRGLYAQQLERYHRHLGADRVLALNSTDLFERTRATLQRVFEFVGVDPDFRVPDREARNVGTASAGDEAEARAYLDDFFAPHNEALYELIGERFDW